MATKKASKRVKGNPVPVDRMIRQSRTPASGRTTETHPDEAREVLESLMASGSGATTAGSKMRGYEGQVYYTVGTGTATLFANITDFDLDVKADSIDATDRATVGWKDKFTGLKEWSGSLSANAIQNGVDQIAFYAALTGGTTLSASFRPQDITAGLAYTGSFVVSGYKYNSKQSGVQTLDLTIEGRGALVLGSVANGGA